MTFAYLVLVGLALGFSLTIPPGPMNALIAVRSGRSFRAGVTTGLGAMSADVVLGVLVYLLHTLVDLTPIVRWVEAAGAVIMAYFAYRVLTREAQPSPPDPGPEVRVFSEALLVGVTNPLQVGWWLTAGLAFAYLGGAWLLGGLFGAIAIWIVAFPLALSYGARKSERFPRAVALASGLLMAGFAAYFALLVAGVPL
ncbi:MAG TPA: LysE family transporter [Thermoplasmata archaeon]|nr:LysE family transporter [Thermoplasmata archaeon]